MRAVTVMRSERVWHVRQRLLQMLFQAFWVRHGPRHFAHPVHIVRHTDQARWDRIVRYSMKGVADHSRAHHLTKGPDMRQTRRAVAGFVNDRVCPNLAAFAFDKQAFDQLARLLNGPRLALGEDRINRF